VLLGGAEHRFFIEQTARVDGVPTTPTSSTTCFYGAADRLLGFDRATSVDLGTPGC
jgi:hypothetical protein